MQGVGKSILGGVPLRKNFLLTGLLLGCLLLSSSTVMAADYPDTSTCAATPTIDFPANVTIGKDFLLFIECGTADFNSGDFVSVWIEDSASSPIMPVSEFVETDFAGVEWVSPLSNNAGQAWKHINISPDFFDCNSTGVPYNVQVNWDTQIADANFNVYCPTIELIKYRQNVSYWETLRVEAQVSDVRGYRMKGIPCKSKVLDIGRDANSSAITIKQEYEEVLTDRAGRARFEYTTGLLDDLLQGYTYNVEVVCLGGDANFDFTIGQQESQYLRNPVYFFFVFVADNVVPILGAFLIGVVAVGIIYAIFKRREETS